MEDYIELVLNRGTSGLGFNIRGGVDQPHLPNDKGIFVTKIRDNGAAAADGTLQEGDKVIEVNGQPMEGLTHNEAVNSFLNAGADVTLKIWPSAEKILLDKLKRGASDNGDHLKRNILFGVVIVLIGITVWFYKDNLTDFIRNFTKTSPV